jgi:DNA primase
MAPEPVLCFDGDKAGLKAAWRAADLALPSIQAGRTVRFAMLPEGQDPDDLVRAGGPDAFRKVLAETRALAEMVWLRETQGGVFETPERRAELEKSLREATSRIRDENVRRHYQQDMRERVQAFFGTNRPQRKWQPGERGGDRGKEGWGRGQRPSGRLAVSDSLARSALVRTSAAIMPVRGAVLMAALVNHPPLIDEFFDQVERLDLGHADLQRLHGGLLDAVAHGEAGDRDAIVASMARAGLGPIWETAVALVRRTRQWPALEEAALDDARDAFSQAMHLHQSAGFLHKELRAAEAALALEPTEENYRQLLAIQTQFRDVQATEALIEGFGVSSGRTGGKG